MAVKFEEVEASLKIRESAKQLALHESLKKCESFIDKKLIDGIFEFSLECVLGLNSLHSLSAWPSVDII